MKQINFKKQQVIKLEITKVIHIKCVYINAKHIIYGEQFCIDKK